MGSTAIAASEYWGYLIKPDKSPSPLLEKLLLGIANYVVSSICRSNGRQTSADSSLQQTVNIYPWDVQCLTPNKLAHFYRLVGGNCDGLFLETPQASLSFIYQSLGCYHSLQPEKNPFAPPSVPVLTPHGYVRWQTVQVLLQPDQHVPFLQEAVKRFDIINPADGRPFPRQLPMETFPVKPDPEMTGWYDSVSERLLLEAEAAHARRPPTMGHSVALSDGEPESVSITSSPVNNPPIPTNASGHHPHPHLSSHIPGILRSHPSPPLDPAPNATSLNFAYVNPPRSANPPRPPHSTRLHSSYQLASEHRRNSSLPPRHFARAHFQEGLAPSNPRARTAQRTYRSRPHRPPSTSSISSSSSSSCSSSEDDLTGTDSALSSPDIPRRASSSPIFSSASTPIRRHSSSSLTHDYAPHHHRPERQPLPQSHQRRTSYFELNNPSTPPRAINPNTRGLNVRWRESPPQAFGSAPGTPGEETRVLETRGARPLLGRQDRADRAERRERRRRGDWAWCGRMC